MRHREIRCMYFLLLLLNISYYNDNNTLLFQLAMYRQVQQRSMDNKKSRKVGRSSKKAVVRARGEGHDVKGEAWCEGGGYCT